MGTISIDSLEIFRKSRYFPANIGMVSDNAYLSIVAHQQMPALLPYCINSGTDRRLDLPIDKAMTNISRLVGKYGVREAIILGGEPLLHPDILGLIRRLRTESGLETVRLTTTRAETYHPPTTIRGTKTSETPTTPRIGSI